MALLHLMHVPLSSKTQVSSMSPHLLRHISLEVIQTDISLSNVLSIEYCINFSYILMWINVKLAGIWLNGSPTLPLSSLAQLTKILDTNSYQKLSAGLQTFQQALKQPSHSTADLRMSNPRR